MWLFSKDISGLLRRPAYNWQINLEYRLEDRWNLRQEIFTTSCI